ncbi:MAG: hypothetical protein J1E63_01750 [Muribaculaceae bacterium]|nr:hypothetical protein [Muribaculaceae bacterium]
MKNFIITLVFAVFSLLMPATASAENASLTINNRSGYTLTVKVMKVSGGLFQTVTISPNSSRTIYFGASGAFYCKTKAERWGETLYKKGGSFSVQCDSFGYTQGSLDFFVSSGYGSSGSSISKAEFEKNN